MVDAFSSVSHPQAKVTCWVCVCVLALELPAVRPPDIKSSHCTWMGAECCQRQGARAHHNINIIINIVVVEVECWHTHTHTTVEVESSSCRADSHHHIKYNDVELTEYPRARTVRKVFQIEIHRAILHPAMRAALAEARNTFLCTR